MEQMTTHSVKAAAIRGFFGAGELSRASGGIQQQVGPRVACGKNGKESSAGFKLFKLLLLLSQM
jgi:hypothetical protein